MKKLSEEELKKLIEGIDASEQDDKDFYDTDADDMIGRKYPGVSDKEE